MLGGILIWRPHGLPDQRVRLATDAVRSSSI
jgi:hypothetical protein